MVISPENVLLVGAVLLFLSVLVGKTGARFGVPALLLFLGVGMLAGSDGFGIHFDSAPAAQFIGTVALCIILFSGGMDTSYREIKPVLAPGVTLATLGVLMTTVITGLFIYSLSDFLPGDFQLGLLESIRFPARRFPAGAARVDVAGGRDVVDRLGFGLFDSAVEGHFAERAAAPHARVGERQ